MTDFPIILYTHNYSTVKCDWLTGRHLWQIMTARPSVSVWDVWAARHGGATSWLFASLRLPWSQRFFLFFIVLVGAAREPRSGEKGKKPLVTLDLNLTFMQTPAVKRVNLIKQKVSNGSLAITCLSAANVSTRVVKSGIFWPTWPGSMCVFARMFSSAMIAKVNCLLNITMQASPLFVL